MKTLVIFITLLLGVKTFAQTKSSLELSYDFTPSKLVYYDLSKPGSYETRSRQPFSYLGTLKYNRNFKKNTIGIGVRGFWLNRSEKSLGAQLDYYRNWKKEEQLTFSVGLSTIWDGYRFKYSLGTKMKIDMHTVKMLPNVKLVYRLKDTKWKLKASGGLGIGFTGSEYWETQFSWTTEYESIHKQKLWSNPYLTANLGVGIVRDL